LASHTYASGSDRNLGNICWVLSAKCTGCSAPRQLPNRLEIEHTRLREAFERMGREELEAYARDGVLPEWFPKDETVE
jgi:hypothetical protein